MDKKLYVQYIQLYSLACVSLFCNQNTNTWKNVGTKQSTCKLCIALNNINCKSLCSWLPHIPTKVLSYHPKHTENNLLPNSVIVVYATFQYWKDPIILALIFPSIPRTATNFPYTTPLKTPLLNYFNPFPIVWATSCLLLLLLNLSSQPRILLSSFFFLA